MKMQIGKWGNSLAVRLPREMVERFGLREGRTIDSAAIEAALKASETQDRQARREAAIIAMKKLQFPLPDDYKFDRDDANARPATDRW